ncbi:polysaccharide deacetylase family protein [uncultured Oscillibacter sp.]|uniref:polysaccharide deacetylase family protein n=1 Tax=uncultured Oscillibacter sp. TaxID=876091 RepID=UPI0025E64CC1|nr:polysaccharide deacetylase family protein [uncultured Oscillibacter sp.]
MKKRLHCCALPLVLCAVLVSLSAGPRQILAAGPPDGGEAVLPSPGRETARMVALTFDDGPDPVYTDEILDVLERCGARATFFEVGEKLRDVPGALEREEALGCEVGSHSYSHQKFSKIGGGEALADMEASDAAFTEVLGRVPELLRPPYGAWNAALDGTGYAAVTWSVDPADWQCRDAGEIVSFLQGLELDGQVVLLHSLYESTVEAVEVLVPWLQEQGYELVTVSELMERRFGAGPEPGHLYDAHFFWSALPEEPPRGSYSNYKPPQARTGGSGPGPAKTGDG